MTVSEQVLECYRNGFKDAKQIKAELDRQEPSVEHSLSSIRSYLSVIKKTEKNDNSDSTQSIDNISNTSHSPDNTINSEPIQKMENEASTNETPQIQATTFTPIDKKPAGKLIVGAPFQIQGGEMSAQLEGADISKNYQDTFQQQATVDPTKVVYVDRIGEVSGKLTKMIFALKPIQKFTHGYKIETQDAKRLDEDMSMMLKSRLPVTMSEYADFINLGIDAALVGVKAIFHRFETPLPEEFKNEIKQSEDNLKQVGESIVNQIKDNVEQNKIPDNVCQNCLKSSNDLKLNTDFNKILCAKCDYDLNLQKATSDNQP